MYDGVKFGYELHRKMLQTYEPERIVWIGYSAGAVLVMGLGRHIAHENYELPMPGDAPDYEAAFKRSGMKDYSIHIEPDTFHAYPAFTFTPEGRKGEQQVIDYIKEKMSS